jgi:thioredoxin
MKRLVIFMVLMSASIGTMAACGNGSPRDQKVTATELSSKDFNLMVYDLEAEGLKYLGDKPAIIDFNATWCGPCRRIAPILDELAQEYKGQIVIYKVDVDKCPDVAEAFGIQSIPAVLYIPVDSEPQMTIGSRSKTQFQQEIEKILLKK